MAFRVLRRGLTVRDTIKPGVRDTMKPKVKKSVIRGPFSEGWTDPDER